MEEIMDQLIDVIKQQPYYKNFKNSEKKLDLEQDILICYRQVLDEYEEMKKYEDYVDITSIKDKLRKIQAKMNDSKVICDYYQSLHQLNDQLDEITKIIFQDISDDLLVSQFKLR